jgi:hypothetical protein
MSAAAISCCVLILIFIMDVGGHNIVLCADFKNLKLKLKLGMPPSGRAMAAVAAAKASAAAKAAAAPAKANLKGRGQQRAELSSDADEDAPPDPKRGKKSNVNARKIAKQAAAEVEALTEDYEDDSHGATPADPGSAKVAVELQRETAAAERQRVIALNKKETAHAEELRRQADEIKKLKLQLEKAQAKPSAPSTPAASKQAKPNFGCSLAAKEQQLRAPRKNGNSET